MTPRKTSEPTSPKRRWLLKTGLVIGAVGAALGGSVFWKRGISNGRLTEPGRAVLKGVGRAVLSDMLPTDPSAREIKLEGMMKRLSEIITSMPTSSQQELAALLGLLANAPTRLLIAGLSSPWETASTEDIAQALESMRINKLPTTVMSYHAVRDLAGLAFFTNPDNWSLIGYPGPLDI
ncbi:MAG: hypothetical protein KGL90_10805 [Burkholderiales bacterium]|nr:hypothetical protein [Burkholderiales bacterium]